MAWLGNRPWIEEQEDAYNQDDDDVEEDDDLAMTMTSMRMMTSKRR
jgi:hypothetical protein